jgi:S-adenosylmethionine:tRNA ribosyltransferase-isomerase
MNGGGEAAELFRIGIAPLPPYIKRKDPSREAVEEDLMHYQTVFAKYDGSIAAPTAGLHFTSELLEELDKKGIKTAEITLHVGKATFLPVKSETVEGHKMGLEYYDIESGAAEAINKAKGKGGRVIAVGTTVVRTLETVRKKYGIIKADKGESDLFITEGFRFGAVDAMITNFHLPASTNLIMVAAFAGRKHVLDAYNEAVSAGYRFYSYGDAMMII